ncbi:MAG: hypothetical protein FWD45_04545 [Coriobacteriia bacterium]|nr:hypothetical protein [Coriobacteriia bacterium]
MEYSIPVRALLSNAGKKPYDDLYYYEKIVARLTQDDIWVDAIVLSDVGGLGYRAQISYLRSRDIDIITRVNPETRKKKRTTYQYALKERVAD